MTEAPKRIWRNELGFCFDSETEAIEEGVGYSPFVRADIADEMLAALKASLSTLGRAAQPIPETRESDTARKAWAQTQDAIDKAEPDVAT